MISLILAIGKNNEIGFENKVPWDLPDDLKRFRDTTRGHTIIMGRKTYESIGRLLPDRKNIIITRNKSYKIEGASVVSSIEEAIQECEKEGEAFVIGGGEICKLALPYAEKMYLTHVDTILPADSFFPEFNITDWKIISQEFHPRDQKHNYEFTFKVYEKI